MRRRDAGGVLGWTILVALLLGTAIVGALSLQGNDDPEASDPLVGDLRLADDEGPSDHVEHTFGAPNLAPGEGHTDELGILREPFEGLPPALEPRVEVTLHGQGSNLLASSLEVVEIAYGDRSLEDAARRACGVPLTLARLAACTTNDPNPLAALPDPTPEGTPFRLGVRMVEHAGSSLQDRTDSFTAHVELYGRTPGEAPRSPGQGEQGDKLVQTAAPHERPAACAATGTDVGRPSSPGVLPVEPRDADLPPQPPARSIEPLWREGPRPATLIHAHLIELC